ncbi:MAG: phosphate acyltransferase [Spirochaetaceae bacterium]|jgi:phosphate butyryltransferase|nr:phosphate acyltransferase [Spirochaetaceae bacterium]
MHTGNNIKKLRKARGYTIEKLADLIGCPGDYISRLEEKDEEASVSELLKISAALSTDISALIYGKEFNEGGVRLTRPETRRVVERRKRHKYESLAPDYSGRHIEPFLVEVYEQDDNNLEYSSHEGEEFHYVIEGTLKIIVDGKEYILNEGDTLYFDSSLKHALTAIGGHTQVLVTIYNKQSMINLSRTPLMSNLIQGAKLIGGMNVVVIMPNSTAIEAVNRAIEEKVVRFAFFVGDSASYPTELLKYSEYYKFVEIDSSEEEFDKVAATKGIEIIHSGDGHMLMKGKINTAIFMKAILNKETGIGTGRRLSLVSIFELPKVDRLIFLTDPGINPALTIANDIMASRDIILNAIDVAQSMGIDRPNVALLDANEKASEKIPTSIFAQQLSEMDWKDANVYGPLSYDLALYEESVKHKGMGDLPVAGKADILIVPHIAGGNFLYKSWAMTMGSDVANVVLGAKVPIILTSRSDSDMTKFLTLCASAVYSQHVLKK